MLKIKNILIAVLFYAAINQPVEAMQFIAGQASVPEDYTVYPDCVGAWQMNSNDDETDVSGNGNTLVENSGDIPTCSLVPPGWDSGTLARQFDWADSEWLSNSDEDELDISGADQQISMHVRVAPNIGYYGGDLLYSFGILTKDDGDGNRQYRLYYRRSSAFKVKFRFLLSQDGTNYDYVETTNEYNIGSSYEYVYSVAARYDDVDMRIYVNGVLACTPVAHTTGIYDGDADFTIGEFTGGTRYSTFRLEEGIIFKTAMDPSDFVSMHKYGIKGDRGSSD